MGAVYRAHDTVLDRPVALKIPRLAGDPVPAALPQQELKQPLDISLVGLRVLASVRCSSVQPPTGNTHDETNAAVDSSRGSEVSP